MQIARYARPCLQRSSHQSNQVQNRGFYTFLKEQLATVPPVCTKDLSGKVVLVTGANSGIGYETAKHFASMGAEKVILGCRNKARGEDAVRRLTAETGRTNAELQLVDLASFTSIRAFVDQFDSEKLDFLVSNAGIVTGKYKETEDGWEQSLQVNHLGPALLTTLLLPKLYAAASTQSTSPRVVFVSSDAHRDAALPRKTLEASSVLRHISSREGSLPYNLIHKYRLAKLINVLFARALSAHLAPPPSSPTSRPPIVNSVDPGLCYSEMTRGATEYLVFRMAMSVLARTAEEGARQLIWASIGSPGASTTLPSDPSDLDGEAALRGAFISSMKIRKPGGLASREKGREFERLLWDDTLKILAAVDERVPLIIKDYLS